MDIMEKLGGVARKVGDRTAELAKQAKLNGKLYKESSAVRELQQQIGEICFGKFRAGDELDPEVEQLCISVAKHKQTMAEIQRSLCRMQSAASAQADAAQGAPMAFCPSCGAKLERNAKFCASCSRTLDVQ